MGRCHRQQRLQHCQQLAQQQQAIQHNNELTRVISQQREEITKVKADCQQKIEQGNLDNLRSFAQMVVRFLDEKEERIKTMENSCKDMSDVKDKAIEYLQQENEGLKTQLNDQQQINTTQLVMNAKLEVGKDFTEKRLVEYDHRLVRKDEANRDKKNNIEDLKENSHRKDLDILELRCVLRESQIEIKRLQDELERLKNHETKLHFKYTAKKYNVPATPQFFQPVPPNIPVEEKPSLFHVNNPSPVYQNGNLKYDEATKLPQQNFGYRERELKADDIALRVIDAALNGLDSTSDHGLLNGTRHDYKFADKDRVKKIIIDSLNVCRVSNKYYPIDSINKLIFDLALILKNEYLKYCKDISPIIGPDEFKIDGKRIREEAIAKLHDLMNEVINKVLTDDYNCSNNRGPQHPTNVLYPH